MPAHTAQSSANAILSSLNPVQREAVLHDKGPLLILAGAGSGKTRVLTHRIAYLIQERGVSPSHILAVTFTNKAAGEMRQRLEKLLGGAVAHMWCGTFHAICARILRDQVSLLGYTSRFAVYDADDQRSVVKLMLKELGLSDRDYPPRMVQAVISRAKNALIGPEEFAGTASGFRDQRIAEVYTRYQAALKANNALDFDDLLTHPIHLFDAHPALLKAYQDRFQYVLIDEYQDTNHAQYVLVEKLSAGHKNLCVVGDDDQSIYGFRGADIRNILDFERDYPDARVIRLEQNYRSTQTILDAANGVVRNNQDRKPKKLWTQNETGSKVVLLESLDERHEGRRIVEAILQKKRALGDFVILYRTNAQSRALEDELRRAGMAYVIVGGVRFYERKEIKDVLAYLRLISNPMDSVSLRRIINVPRRGVGEVTMQALEEFVADSHKPLLEAVEAADRLGIPPGTAKRLTAFAGMIRSFGESGADVPIADLTQELLERIGYLEALKKESLVDAQIRIDNVKELVSAMADFAEEAEDPSLNAFLEKVSLITDVDQWNGEGDAVTLMTLHCAKGLEFPVVFISGLEEGLFPLNNAAQEQDELEEERRLFYVGITRAQQDLVLCHAFQRRKYGVTMGAQRSRFLDEVPRQLVDVQGVYRPAPDRQAVAPVAGGVTVDYAAYDDVPLDELPFKVGHWVIHPTFGRGQILERSGSGPDTRFLIAFQSGAKKRIVAKYAHLDPG